MSNTPSRTATPSRGTGSATLQQTQPNPVLRLRAEPETRRHIQWAEDVIDNEGMGKKSSKVCCIYHAPREAGESSDESDSDSSSSDDSDSEPDNSTARPSKSRSNPRARKAEHAHGHGDDSCGHDHGPGEGSGTSKRKPKRAPSPNAYEKIPKPRK